MLGCGGKEEEIWKLGYVTRSLFVSIIITLGAPKFVSLDIVDYYIASFLVFGTVQFPVGVVVQKIPLAHHWRSVNY